MILLALQSKQGILRWEKEKIWLFRVGNGAITGPKYGWGKSLNQGILNSSAVMTSFSSSKITHSWTYGCFSYKSKLYCSYCPIWSKPRKEPKTKKFQIISNVSRKYKFGCRWCTCMLIKVPWSVRICLKSTQKTTSWQNNSVTADWFNTPGDKTLTLITGLYVHPTCISISYSCSNVVNEWLKHIYTASLIDQCKPMHRENQQFWPNISLWLKNISQSKLEMLSIIAPNLVWFQEINSGRKCWRWWTVNTLMPS